MEAPFRSSSLVAVLLLATVLVAVAAVTIGSLPSSGGGSAGASTPGSQLVIDLPGWAWGLLFLSPLIVGYGFLLFRRLTEPSASVRIWSVVVFLVVGVIFGYLLLHGGAGGQGSVGFGPPTSSSGTGSNNSSGSGTNNSSGSGNSSGNGTSPGAGGAVTFHFAVPPYAVWIAALAVCVLVGALTVPGVAARLAARDRSRPKGSGRAPPDREEIAAAMQDAASALEQGQDPRDTIVRLYVRLLLDLSMVTGELMSLTAEEVRQTYLIPLGVSAADAETLTRLFEEARYSSHPIDPASVVRAREAMRRAESGLRSGVDAT